MFSFGVGPTQLSPEVKQDVQQAMQDDICTLSHRSKEFSQISSQVHQYLRKLLHIPHDYKIFYTASATDAMEISLRSFVSKRSHHFINGTFSQRYFDASQAVGKTPSKQELPWGEGAFDLTNIPQDAELLGITHNETSTGVVQNRKTITQLKEANPNMLLAVDITSSVGATFPPIPNIDITFFSVQKGLGLPSGLGLLIVSPQAVAKYEAIKDTQDIGFTHSLPYLLKKNDVFQTFETPNMLNIYLLSRQLQRFDTLGAETIEAATQEKFTLLDNLFTQHPVFNPYVKNPTYRSPYTYVIRYPEAIQKTMYAALADADLGIGNGYAGIAEFTSRIANYPAIHRTHITQLLEVFDQIK